MLKRVITLATLCVLLGAVNARAQQNCDGKTSDFDAVYCLSKVFVQADADLNTAYQKLRGQLNAAGQLRLRDLERAWIARRNRECVGDSGRGKLVYVDCAVQMTVDRANFLNDRYRECITSGCRVSALR